MLYDLPPKLFIPAKPALIRSGEDIRAPSLEEMCKYGANIPAGMYKPSGDLDPQLTYRGAFTRGSTTSSTSHTIASVAFGTAHASRIVIITLPAIKGTWTACTIGGVTATILLADPSGKGVGFAWANVPTGTSGSVVLTAASASTNNDVIWVHTFLGKAAIYDSVVSLNSNGTGTITLADIAVKAGGVLFFHLYKTDTSNPPPGFSYTGVDSMPQALVIDNSTDLRAGKTTETVTTNDILLNRTTTMAPYALACSFEGV